MTALRIDAVRAARVKPDMRPGKPLPRLYKPGEYAAEERKKTTYRVDHEERLYHARRCTQGDQFRNDHRALPIH